MYVCICRIIHTHTWLLDMFKSVDVEDEKKVEIVEIHPGYKSCSLSVWTSPSQPDQGNKTLTKSRENMLPRCCGPLLHFQTHQLVLEQDELKQFSFETVQIYLNF